MSLQTMKRRKSLKLFRNVLTGSMNKKSIIGFVNKRIRSRIWGNLTLNCRKHQPPFYTLSFDVSILFFLRCITVTMEYITHKKIFPKSSMFSKAATRNVQNLNGGTKFALWWNLTKFVNSNDPCMLLRKKKHLVHFFLISRGSSVVLKIDVRMTFLLWLSSWEKGRFSTRKCLKVFR